MLFRSPVRRCNDTISQRLERRGREDGNVAIVLDQQDGLVADRQVADRFQVRLGLDVLRATCARKIELHRRPLPHLAVDADMAAGLLGKATNHAEAKARALALRLRRDRKSDGSGKSVSLRVDLGGHRTLTKNTRYLTFKTTQIY